MTAPRSTTLAATSGSAPPKPASRSSDPAISALMGALSKMKTVLPAHITPERMARLALGSLRTDAKLRDAALKNPDSLVSAVMLASQAGLEIGGAKGHGYLVPYWNGKTKQTEVQFLPGYRGLLDLARRSGQVTTISANVVYANDTFDMALGLEERITHVPLLTGDRGAPTLVYGVARFTDGSYHFDWMTIGQVDKVMLGSQSKGEWGPWKDHKDEMTRKTMIRRLVKYLPMSSDRLDLAVTASDADDDSRTLDADFMLVEEDAPAQLGNDPSETIDQGTGEITRERETAAAGGETTDAPAGTKAASVETKKPEAGTTKPATGGAPIATFAEVQDALNKAKTLDQLDDAASLINAVGNRGQQKDLNTAYAARRTELGGD